MIYFTQANLYSHNHSIKGFSSLTLSPSGLFRSGASKVLMVWLVLMNRKKNNKKVPVNPFYIHIPTSWFRFFLLLWLHFAVWNHIFVEKGYGKTILKYVKYRTEYSSVAICSMDLFHYCKNVRPNMVLNKSDKNIDFLSCSPETGLNLSKCVKNSTNTTKFKKKI